MTNDAYEDAWDGGPTSSAPNLDKLIEIFLETGRTLVVSEWCRFDGKGYIRRWSITEKPAVEGER